MNDIERLLAIEGIKTTKARYFRCLDTKDLAGYASVFAPDPPRQTSWHRIPHINS